MAYQHIRIPESGEKITVKDGKLQVPDQPIVGYVEGDGIGPDITRASLRVWDAAIEEAYGGERKIHWVRRRLKFMTATTFPKKPSKRSRNWS